MSFQCPLADETDPAHPIQKVSALVARDAGQYSTADHPDYPPAPHNMLDRDLVAKLAAPAAPEVPRGTIGSCWETLTYGFMAFMTILCFILFPAAAFLDPEEESLGEILSVFFVMAVLYFGAVTLFHFIRATTNSVRYRLEKPRWDRAMAKWENLYYCYRHDIVFHPETEQFRPAQLVNELLHTSRS